MQKNPSPNKNTEDQMPPNKNQVMIREVPMEPYAEVSTLQETEIVSLLAKRSYKVTVSTGLTASHKRPIKCIFDTGAGPNLL